MGQPLWTVDCTTCGARPGEKCYSLVTGRDLPEGHTRRIWRQREWDEQNPEAAVISSDDRDAPVRTQSPRADLLSGIKTRRTRSK